MVSKLSIFILTLLLCNIEVKLAEECASDLKKCENKEDEEIKHMYNEGKIRMSF